MAILGTFILIWIAIFLVWSLLAPKFNKIGSKISNHFKKSINNNKN